MVEDVKYDAEIIVANQFFSQLSIVFGERLWLDL